MESISNRNKRSSNKGFLKGKLQAMSLLHKPTSKPLPVPPPSSGSTPILIHQLDALPAAKHIIKSAAPINAASSNHPQGRVAIMVHQDQYSLPQPTRHVSVHVLSTSKEHQNPSAAVVGLEPWTTKHVKGKFHHHPYPVAVDENVDLKATDYISTVKERFRVPMLN